jgi:glucosyl-3-phosphoglycerate synthase
MSFAILQRFLARIDEYDLVSLKADLYDQMIQFNHQADGYQQDIYSFQKQERPPMITIEEYNQKLSRKKREAG